MHRSRYCEKHGIQQKSTTSSSTHATVSQPSVVIDLDHPLKPTPAAGTYLKCIHLVEEMSWTEALPLAPSAPVLDDFDASEDTPPAPAPTTTATSSTSGSSYTTSYSPPAVPLYNPSGNDDEEGGCECCKIEKPHGGHSCCVWECRQCGVCKMADDCKPASCAFIFPFTTLLCGVSFGSCSNWWTRTICGKCLISSFPTC